MSALCTVFDAIDEFAVDIIYFMFNGIALRNVSAALCSTCV